MMNSYKIIFSGPVGSGKTTAINSASDIDTIKTEQTATDDTKNLKSDTTVALDYGAILENGSRINLYGTPGQKRFNFMWDVLTKGGDGLLLLIDGNNINALENLNYFLDAFKPFIQKTNVIVGITKHDLKKQYKLSDYHDILNKHLVTTSIFEVDVRNSNEVKLMVKTLLSIS